MFVSCMKKGAWTFFGRLKNINGNEKVSECWLTLGVFFFGTKLGFWETAHLPLP